VSRLTSGSRVVGGSRVTRAVRAGLASDPGHRSVMPPLYLSTNFVFEGPGACGAYDYTRSGNPTRDVLARALADAEEGETGIVTASGMAAAHVVTQLLSAGDTMIAPHDLYGGCHRLFLAQSRRVGFDVHFLDQSALQSIEIARRLRPTMIWIETPSNPLLRVIDLGRWARVARDVGAVSVADNTFLSPANQRPLDHGVDIVVHSTTKFINGHSDVVGGAIVTREKDLGEELAWWTNCIGCAGSPFDSFLTGRGLRTLAARSAVHEANALAVVGTLREGPAAAVVHHPSLPGHPGHEIAVRQQTGWGSLVSVDLRGGRAAVDGFLDGLEHFTLAESLGGVESLIAHPATMTHASMDEDARRTAGIGAGLLRLSVGIESEDDLVSDIEKALRRAARATEASCPGC
jgi:cystathionine gamma-synthase